MFEVSAVRAVALNANFSAHGVPATVTPPEQVAITTRIIWVTPVTELVPGAVDFQRAEPKRVMALRRDEVPSVPRGTIVLAPEKAGEADQRWRVEGTERQEADHTRVYVLPDQEP